MAKPNTYTKRFTLTLLFTLLCLFTGILPLSADDLDTTKYFPFEDIQPGMDAYCLSVISGTKIEKFPLKVVSKIKNFKPGMDRILIIGTDEVFQKIGAVQGCSGSPLFIDNRIAGALSAGYPYSKDPIYLVTPIKEMLAVGKTSPQHADSTTSDKLNIDYTKPINLSTVYEKLISNIEERSQQTSTLSRPLALATSLPVDSCPELSDLFKQMNVTPVAGISSASSLDFDSSEQVYDSYRPGGILSLPLVFGDIAITAVGTITDVIDDTVYGFGHDFLGQGPLNIPMSTGYIHTVIPSLRMSFKMGSASAVSGTLVFDENSGIVGKIGQEPKLIPITVTVDRFNDTQTRVYNSKMLYHTLYTPYLLQSVIVGPALAKGAMPDEHTVSYRLQIGIDGFEPVVFDDVSSGNSVREPLTNVVGFTSLIMSNPFRQVDITSIDVDLKITNKDTLGLISSVEIEDKIVKPGQTLDLTIILERFLARKTIRTAQLKIPSDIQPGKYVAYVLSGNTYERIITKLSSHRYSAYSLPTLVKAMQNISEIKRNKIYIVLKLPSDGITIQEKELPHLPRTKTLLLANPKRTTDINPYTPWIETSIDTDMVISGGQEIIIQVQE